MIDTKNDEVRVFDNAAGEWGWRRVDLGNGRIVSRSSGSDSGGYVDHDYAVEAAKAYNADGCRVVEHTPVGVVVHREEQ